MQDKYVTFGDNTGAPVFVAADASGALVPNGVAALTPSAANASGLVYLDGPGLVYDVNINTGATPVFIMLFDADELPVNGAVVPLQYWQVAANSTLPLGWLPPLAVTVGAVFVASTTGPTTLTLSETCYFGGRVGP